MNLLKKKWINTNKLNVIYNKDKMIIENKTNNHCFLVYPHVFKARNEKEISLTIEGNLIYGTGCTLKILNRHKTIMGQCGLNSSFSKKFYWLKFFILSLYIPGNSKIEITKIEYSPTYLQDSVDIDRFFTHDTLLITPGYPSLENKYNTAFVHTRVQAYKKAGMDLDVAVINSLPETRV